MRILISDNSWSMATLAKMMRDAGFYVSEARDGADLIAHVEQGHFDAVVIDPDLPDMPGTSALRTIRRINARLPIVLMARSWDEAARLRAYAAGADDLIALPLDGPAIASRLRAYARRAHGFAVAAPECAGLRVDLDRQVVTVGGQPIRLTRLEYELTEMLVLANGRLVTREEIMTKLYGWDDEPDEKIIDVYICRIRSKLAGSTAAPGLIATCFGHGYRIDKCADPVADIAA